MKRLMIRVFPVAAVAAGVAVALTLRAQHADSHVTVEVSHSIEAHAEHAEHAEHQEHATDYAFECGDENMETRLAALNALITMDTDKALPILIPVLQNRDECSVELRRKAVFLVSQHETDETVDLLFNAAKTDPDFEVREQAVFWLGQVSADEAVDALESLLTGTDDQEIQEKVIFSLSQHGSQRANGILHDYAGDASGVEGVREQAIFWLGQEGSREDVEFLMDLFDDLESSELKEKVIFSVSQASHSGGDEWLLNLARNEDESTDIRKNALFWVGQEGNINPAELKALYENAQDFELREHAIFVLSQFDGSEATTVLIDIAKSEANADLRDKALFWLGESSDPRAARFLAELINR
ncbi:HEAT repeat domain-containing protein [Gemmatimonadota bacterium]